ncbi:CBS domain-containing protein CBSX1, chloroplastic [Tetrabaena socialis]|uniref:CBS domain-containing protein CBSX1, chloroplastic n=1 Tax=Tetrabaena socialis TaxID=47790 RepID=A0A2J8A9H3_9CHLO|nr:CBS domain-containing protein CBSX1, chloroplastic [Tetrabaena socialis]|eukprot:PNH09178.1 CBS domain-containing protein CBSX1, chloroplastic [Tetrabaena socialis]
MGRSCDTPPTRKIREVMTQVPITVKQDTCLNDATSILLIRKLRRLPVVDDEGRLVGLLSRGSIVKAALASRKAAANN